MFEANRSRFVNGDSQLEEIDDRIRHLEKERRKLQTEKLEYNRWLREDARDEMFVEQICDAIRSLPKYEPPAVLPTYGGSKDWLLAFGDEHYGTEFCIRSITGSVINEYSPEIFERRIADLFNQTIALINKEEIDTLHIFSMGDFTDGCLRVGQLMRLRYGVVEGTIRYSDIICDFLNRLSQHVNIEYQMASDANHSELRMLGQPKGTFKDDNMSLVVEAMIKTRLEDNPNFKFVKNPSGYMVASLANNIVVGFHGESKNMESALKDLSMVFGNTNIDYLLAGHYHHARTEEIGNKVEIINIPSIIGTDPYAMSLHRSSCPAAKLFGFEYGKGRTCEYTIVLD